MMHRIHESSKNVSAQFRLGGGCFNRNASYANRVFVELLCCLISLYKYIGAVHNPVFYF